MNLWECEELGCKSTAVGCGGAVGLRAVGWFMAPGLKLYCPRHRPDATKTHAELHGDEDDSAPCSMCMADIEAASIQLDLNYRFGFQSTESTIETARLLGLATAGRGR